MSKFQKYTKLSHQCQNVFLWSLLRATLIYVLNLFFLHSYLKYCISFLNFILRPVYVQHIKDSINRFLLKNESDIGKCQPVFILAKINLYRPAIYICVRICALFFFGRGVSFWYWLIIYNNCVIEFEFYYRKTLLQRPNSRNLVSIIDVLQGGIYDDWSVKSFVR